MIVDEPTIKGTAFVTRLHVSWRPLNWSVDSLRHARRWNLYM